ncbi:hypothetical protein [Variovorax paradoxus]|uniref:Uncharacterized protein n=1 Tax=Variovorax paradoxus TaxID=34073 RepID=A0A679JAG6_VARPD|nr:hypothetical protein VVAX_06097 [Variovorax paradoxus]
MRTRLSPKRALRLGVGFSILMFLLAGALSIGFKAGAGYEWAHRAVLAVGVLALFAGVFVAWCITRSLARSARDADLISQRLDRLFKNSKAIDS